MKLDELRQRALEGEFRDTRPRSDPPPAPREAPWLRYKEHDDHFWVEIDGPLVGWDADFVAKSILDFAKCWAYWPASTTFQLEAQATPPYGNLTAMYSWTNENGDNVGSTNTKVVPFYGESSSVPTVKIPKFRCQSCAGKDRIGGEPGKCLICGREMLV